MLFYIFLLFHKKNIHALTNFYHYFFCHHHALCICKRAQWEYRLFSKKSGNLATLALLNKRTDTPVSIASVQILLASENGKESEKIEIPLSEASQIAPNANVSLGEILTLSQKIAPKIDTSGFKSVTVSENPDCLNCRSVPFGLKINVDYQGGAKQENLTGAYLHYFSINQITFEM